MLRVILGCGLGLATLVGCASTGGDEAQAVHRVELQIRSGAGGGNPNRIDMNGETSIYVRRFSQSPLDMDAPVSMGDESVAYCSDGRIPDGVTFVVTDVEYRGTSVGDTNGPGEFKLVVGGNVLAHSSSSHLPIRGTWRGRIEVTRDQMQDVYLEVRNSSTGSVVIEGHLVSDPDAEAIGVTVR
jgi:hypothetical protein